MLKKTPVTPLKKFVASMHCSQREQIISDFVDWETSGSIGDCELRRSASKFMAEINLKDDAYITMYMRELAMQCYIHIVEENYLDD